MKAFQLTSPTMVVREYPLDEIVTSDAKAHDVRAYLLSRLSQLPMNAERIAPFQWPRETDLTRLVELSNGLFQWAATAARWLEDDHPEQQLADLLKGEWHGLDDLYLNILQRAAAKYQSQSSRKLALLQHVLCTVAVARMPLSLDSLAYLYVGPSAEVPTSELIQAEVFDYLRCFLVIPLSVKEPVRFIHPSVIDFITDSARCNDIRFAVNAGTHHSQLALTCFDRMERDLKQNICMLEDILMPNAEIATSCIDAKVPMGLRYCSLYWCDHLALGDSVTVKMFGKLYCFATRNLLSWLEVLSLINALSKVSPVATSAQALLMVCFFSCSRRAHMG